MLKTSANRAFAIAFAILCLTASRSEASIVNGDFSTGDFTGWTVFNDPDGTTNADPLSLGVPNVVSFDVTGNGDSLAAGFNVGRSAQAGNGVNQGGGIYQSIQTVSGLLSLSADIAVLNSFPNGQGGFFQLLVNGSVVDTVDIGSVTLNVPVRDTLSVDDLAVGAGSQEIRLTVQRQFAGAPDSPAIQFIDNVTATGTATAVPEPMSALVLLIGTTTVGLRRRKRNGGR